jgi:hypothetical protein
MDDFITANHAVTADEEASQREPGPRSREIARTFDCDIA